jgi:TetR/AcrR family transcriptional regulator
MEAVTGSRRPRDPERTRKQILTAAEREFSAKGFAGARVDAIARRARVNKRMLYHYFGNKEGLFREILLRMMTRRDSPFRSLDPPPSISEHLLHFHQACAENPDFVRLLEWEALTLGNRRLIAEDERSRQESEGLQQVRRAQIEGWLPADVDAGQWLLTMMGLIIFPFAFPQMTRLVTGLAPGDPEFLSRRAEFLPRFAKALAAAPATPTPTKDKNSPAQRVDSSFSRD